MKTILYYVSGHGFGHAKRTNFVASELASRFGYRVVIRTDAPSWLFEKETGGEIVIDPAIVDQGPVQSDALTTDIPATLKRFDEALRGMGEKIEKEKEVIDKWRPAVIVSDIAPIGVAVADSLKIPSVVVGNFLWDWILEGYITVDSAFETIAQKLTEIYSTADLYVRPQLHGGMERYKDLIKDTGLITRRSAFSRKEARRKLDLSENQRYALVSMGGMGPGRLLDTFSRNTSCKLLTLGEEERKDSPIQIFDRKSATHEELVMAADLVIGKLGYGLCAELIAARRPILYTPRADFVEYNVLAKEINRYVVAEETPIEELYLGLIDERIERIMNKPAPAGATITTDGAHKSAQYINEMARY